MISSKILIPSLIALACIVALLVGANLASETNETIVFIGVFSFAVAVLLFARDYWWIALFAGVACGGFAYFGFKLYAHECVLFLALAGLIPSIAINPTSLYAQHRPKLPWFFYALAVYLCLHIVFSIALYNPHGFIELGSIGRAYVYGLWPLLFVFLFRLYGRTDLLSVAIYVLQGVYLVRAFMTLATLYFPIASVLPGINFVLPGSDVSSGFDDLRYPGYGICLLATAVLLGKPHFANRCWQSFLIVFSIFILLLSGGRALMVSSLLVLLAGLATARKWKLLAVLGAGVVVLLTFLNLFPSVLYALDNRSQRALSILILDSRSTDVYYQVEGSDVWHQRLQEIGFERWTSSIRTIVFGTGIRPWDPGVARESVWQLRFEALLQGAADTGSYESALWTVLAVTGIVGFLLCIVVVFYFASFNAKCLIRDRLRGLDLTVAFLGAFEPLHWLLFSPRMGGFPGLDLLLAATAFYYLHDRRHAPAMLERSSDEDSPYSQPA
jgi:hypothetical protein